VVRNLETAYAKRDIDAYAKLFAPEFTFKFQPQDAAAGHESWALETELQSTRNMFYSSKVTRIEIRLEVQPAVVEGLRCAPTRVRRRTTSVKGRESPEAYVLVFSADSQPAQPPHSRGFNG